MRPKLIYENGPSSIMCGERGRKREGEKKKRAGEREDPGGRVGNKEDGSADWRSV